MAAIGGIDTYNPAMMGMKPLVRLQPIENEPDARMLQGITRLDGMSAVGESDKADRGGFSKLISNLVTEVDAKEKTSQAEVRKVLTGEVNSLHQSMIAMQEAGMAFSLMVEVRNKLMESYQQVMRMQV